MKKRILILILLALSLVAFVSCNAEKEYEVIYDKHCEAVAIKDFNISDRIELSYSTSDPELVMALDENKSYIAEQVLAVKVNNVCSGGIKDVIEGADICYDAKVA